jgi:hypothetical protein
MLKRLHALPCWQSKQIKHRPRIAADADDIQPPAAKTTGWFNSPIMNGDGSATPSRITLPKLKMISAYPSGITSKLLGCSPKSQRLCQKHLMASQQRSGGSNS